MNDKTKNILIEIFLYILVSVLFIAFVTLLMNKSIVLMYIFIILGIISSAFIIFRKNISDKFRGRVNLSKFNKKRMDIVLIVVFLLSVIFGAITDQGDTFDSTRTIISFIIFSCIFIYLVITITNVVFTKKTIFSDDKFTDEYINMLFIMLFFGFIAIITLDSIPNFVFSLTYIFLLLNTSIFTIEVITSVIKLDIQKMTMTKVLKNIGILLIVFILLIYLQNIHIYKLSSELFTGLGFNLEPYFDLFYYSIVNITSVGFGDIIPLGYFGKITSIISSVFGYVIVFSILGIMVSKFSNNKTEMK